LLDALRYFELDYSFKYTNASDSSQGGTFVMDTLAAVICTNPQGTLTNPRGADIAASSEFGTWSMDKDRHLSMVQVSTAAGAKIAYRAD